MMKNTNKRTYAVISEAEKLKRLTDRQKQQQTLSTIRFKHTEQEQKELEEHIKRHNCPF